MTYTTSKTGFFAPFLAFSGSKSDYSPAFASPDARRGDGPAQIWVHVIFVGKQQKKPSIPWGRLPPNPDWWKTGESRL